MAARVARLPPSCLTAGAGRVARGAGWALRHAGVVEIVLRGVEAHCEGARRGACAPLSAARGRALQPARCRLQRPTLHLPAPWPAPHGSGDALLLPGSWVSSCLQAGTRGLCTHDERPAASASRWRPRCCSHVQRAAAVHKHTTGPTREPVTHRRGRRSRGMIPRRTG